MLATLVAIMYRFAFELQCAVLFHGLTGVVINRWQNYNFFTTYSPIFEKEIIRLVLITCEAAFYRSRKRIETSGVARLILVLALP